MNTYTTEAFQVVHEDRAKGLREDAVVRGLARKLRSRSKLSRHQEPRAEAKARPRAA